LKSFAAAVLVPETIAAMINNINFANFIKIETQNYLNYCIHSSSKPKFSDLDSKTAPFHARNGAAIIWMIIV
jgi:hypothetical protein